MDHDHLDRLRQNHPAWRLLCADHAPLILSFLHRVFVDGRRRTAAHSDLVTLLDDTLFGLGKIHGEARYPRSARDYLESWASGPTPYLRKYYARHGDEPEYDLTPDTERALEWLRGLRERQFVGTESRLRLVYDLLRDIIRRATTDVAARVTELERQRADIDAEIEALRAGRPLVADSTAVKERFFQAEDTARKLLGDFRQVEENFRVLDRETRERIAVSDAPKGELLDAIFAHHDVIADSDQGKSFRAFWELILSPLRQEELEALLDQVLALPAVRELDPDPVLENIRDGLVQAGEKVHRTAGALIEQLRKYLDDQAYLENKRIIQLVRSIEKRAVTLKESPPPERDFASVEATEPELDLIMARGLFVPPKVVRITARAIETGTSSGALDALYEQTYVDEAELRTNIRHALARASQVSLAELVAEVPLRKGLAELVTYFKLASGNPKAHILDVEEDLVIYDRGDETFCQVRMPRVIFIR